MRFRDLPIAVKFSLLLLPAVASLLTALAVIQASLSSASLEGKALADLKQKNELIVGMMDAYNKSLKHTVLREGEVFLTYYPGRYELDDTHLMQVGDGSAPVLRVNGRIVDLDFGGVDRFSELTGGNATIFARKGDDFTDWNWLVASGASIDEVRHESVTLRNYTIAATLLTLVLLAALMYVAARIWIAHPLKSAVAFTRQLASGDLTARLDQAAGDEVGGLLRTIQEMNENLVGIVQQVHASAHNVLHEATQLSTSAEKLVRGSHGQIDAANSAAIRETSATARQLEQLSRSLQDCTSRFKLS